MKTALSAEPEESNCAEECGVNSPITRFLFFPAGRSGVVWEVSGGGLC